eukprot:SAG22_NODE_3088_length_1952_cov_2.536427_3_plen_97_part_00
MPFAVKKTLLQAWTRATRVEFHSAVNHYSAAMLSYEVRRAAADRSFQARRAIGASVADIEWPTQPQRPRWPLLPPEPDMHEIIALGERKYKRIKRK